MIRHEMLAQPWPAFVRSFSFSTCIGHGSVVARRIFDQPRASGDAAVIFFDVRMADGTIRTVTPDMVCDATNVSPRTIVPAPLRIPAPPATRAWS
jgi:hypothetical protein